MTRAAELLRYRQAREDAFPGMGDPAFTMLLDLLAAPRNLTVTNLCDGSHAPYATALRHLDSLVRKGLVARLPDPEDGRRIFVCLTESAIERLGRFEAAIQEMAA